MVFSLLRLGIIARTESPRIQLFPAIALAAALGLSAAFRRSRLFLASLVIAFSHCALVWLSPRISPDAQAVLFQAIALLLPLNLLGFSWLRDRGIISPSGERRLAFIALEVIAVGILMRPRFAHAAALLDRQFFPRHFSNWSGIPQPALIASLLAAVLLALSLARHYRAVNSSLLWTVVTMVISLRLGASTYMAAAYVGCAALTLSLAVLESSYRMAYRDDLTGLPSRRALNEALLKLGDSYTIAMLDVDHFKKFNDTYGHAAGDEALRMVASKLAHVTAGGRAYRYGGEEFTVLFPDKQPEEAFTYLDRLRRLIEQSKFVVRGHERRRSKRNKASRNGNKETNVTVSVGIAASRGKELTVEQVLRSADQALYKAKARGRNCTVVARTAPKSAKVAEPTIRILQVS